MVHFVIVALIAWAIAATALVIGARILTADCSSAHGRSKGREGVFVDPSRL